MSVNWSAFLGAFLGVLAAIAIVNWLTPSAGEDE